MNTGKSQFQHAILALSFMGLAACAPAPADPVMVWETEGFMAPESVLHDAERDVLYVSNISGPPDEANGTGFISKISSDGDVIDLKWVTGLDAPKGLVMDGNRLYVSDIDKLIEIDVATGKVTASHLAPDAKFLNDVAVDSAGSVYVSDMMDDAIYRLKDGRFDLWLRNKLLAAPNGLMVEGDDLLVAAWGEMTKGWETETPGHLKRVSLQTRGVTSLGDATPVGNLDGLEPDGEGGYLSTDWMAGGLFRIEPSGNAVQLLDLDQGSADLEFITARRLAIVPMMMEGKVVAYRIE